MEKQAEFDLKPVPRSIYLAGPFFNEAQLHTIQRIEELCDELRVVCHSPRKFLVLKPRASWEERKLVFRDNLAKIQQSEVVLACLDNPQSDGSVRGPDTGTIWEMGYAHGIRKPVVGFTLADAKMNVMLAQGCDGFLSNMGSVAWFLEGHQTGYADAEHGKLWDWNWEAALEWRKEIF